MPHVVCATATEGYEAGEAGRISATPAHRDGGANLSAGHLITCVRHRLLATVRAGKLDRTPLADETRQALELS